MNCRTLKCRAMKCHGTQKTTKTKIVRTVDHNCAYKMIMAVLMIFPVIRQTVINLRILSIGGQGAAYNN